MKYVFVTGMGRSGTKFLGSLLKLDTDIVSTHEYIGNREFWLLSHYLGGKYSKPYLEREKDRINTNFNCKSFVDVNSYLQNSTDSLKTVFNDCLIYHLVRDPRKVVPSIYIRRDEKNVHKTPLDENEIERWLDMDKLERVCYNWADSTEKLLQSNVRLIQFEKLISDYNYLRDNILIPMDAKISALDYESFKKKKINKTRGPIYRFLYAKYKNKNFTKKQLKFSDFSAKESEVFYDICGPTMKKLGYLNENN